MELDPQAITDLVLSGKWFLLTIPVSWYLTNLLKNNLDFVSRLMPTFFSWVPAFVLNYLGGWGIAAVGTDASWQSTAVFALVYTILVGTPGTVMLHHSVNRAPVVGKDARAARKAKKAATASLLFLVMLLPAGPVGCAAIPPSVVANLPAIFSALGTAEAAVSTFEAWVKRAEGAPGATPERVKAALDLAAQCRQQLAEARALADKGAEFEGQAKQAANQALDTFEALKGALASLGLWNGERLVDPPDGRAACGRSMPEGLEVPLPPRRL